MPKDMHQKAAEHHDQAAKAHRTAAQQHSSNDHVSAKQQSAQAVINLKQLTSIRRRRATRANSRNNAIASQQVASAGLRVGATFFRLKLTRREGAAYREFATTLSDVSNLEQLQPEIGSQSRRQGRRLHWWTK